MTEPFEPINTRARWRILYEDVLKYAVVDQVITYDELAAHLDTSERHVVQQAVRRATQELEEQDLRTVDNIPGVGYRIVKPEEHLLLARRHQRRASRSLVRGHSKLNVDMNLVPMELRPAFEVLDRALTFQMEVNRRMSGSIKQLKKAVSEIDSKVDSERKRTEEEVAQLKARLAALESKADNG